jgi:general secretion pathway protein F
MAKFYYRALSETGTHVRGEIEAASETIAVQQIRSQGHYPISTTSTHHKRWQRFLPTDATKKRPALKDLSIATQELATLLKAGLELDRALGITAGLGETKALYSPLGAVRARVRDGASLADALVAEGGFSPFYVSMVRAGEFGGQLDKTLLRLAEYLQRAHAVREAVVSALVYPIILLCTAGFSIIVILVFVLPQFEPLFNEAGRTLPLSTRVVMAIGHFIGNCWWLICLLLRLRYCGFAVGCKYRHSDVASMHLFSKYLCSATCCAKSIWSASVARLAH